MKKLKLFLAAALMLCSAGAWAQTDVTSTYLTNADFSSSTPIASNLKGYGKDGTPYGFQSVDGWTSVVTSGDNSNTSYPNSGMGGAVFAYGSSWQLQGNNKAAPATNPNGEASGNCLGFFAVWGCGGYYYQDVTFPAGKYIITVPMYSQSGTQANTTYTGFFPTSGTNRTVAVNPTVGQWVNQTVTFTLTAETAGQIRVGYQSTGSGSGANPHLFIDCVKIEYTAAVVKDVLSNALAAATTANAVLGTLTDAISTAQAVYDNANATQEQVNAAAATLNAAVELAMSAAGDVTAMFLTNAGFESCTETTTNAAAGGSAAPLAIDGGWTQVSSASWSSSAVVSYGGSGQVNGASAPTTDNAGNSGKALGVSVGWGGAVTYQSAAITLPAGVYTLKVNAYNNLSGVTQFTSKFGFVPTEGAATMSTKASFAYATWEVDKVTFTLNEATEGKIQVGGQAISGGSGSNAKVFFDNITIEFKSFLAGAKEELQAAIDAAPDATANVGSAVFQVPAAGAATYAEALTAAQAACDATDATMASIEAAKAALEAAIAAYQALELNAPADGQLFNVVLTFAGWTYDQKAMTYLANNREDAGLYNIQYKEAANTNLAQAFTFTKVSGNKYKMSQIDADGVVRYISTGVPYSGGNANQIRTVTEADKALLVEVIPTNVEGVYNLRNTEANNYIGSQDAGVYTVNSHIDFKLVETTKPSIAINTTAAGWGTVMLPFAVASLPEGVKAYTCAAVGEDRSTLTLTQTTALEANKPYIIEGAWKETLSGDAQGTALTATEGLLTGTYAQIAAPVGSYVLQNQSGVVGFYQVEDGTIPNVPANRAYLTYTPSSGVKAFFLGDTEDAIKGVFDGVAAGEIYDLAGRKVQNMQKGNVYIVNGKKVIVK